MECTRCPRLCSGSSYCGFVLGRDLHPWEALIMTVGSVEALPLYHYHPGTVLLKLWVGGYTYRCEGCPWEPLASGPRSLELRPVDVDLIVERAEKARAAHIAVAGAEPLINDWVYEACRELRDRGYSCGYKSSGYVSWGRLKRAARTGDFLVYEVVGDPPGDVDFRVFLDNLSRLRGEETHLEIVYYHRPGSRRSSTHLSAVLGALDSRTPLHVAPLGSEGMPAQEARRLYERAVDSGLKYVYIHGDPWERYSVTHCPSCGVPLVERLEGRVSAVALEDGRCPKCGGRVDIIGLKPIPKRRVVWLLEEDIVW